jgi:hypothetical protein
MPDRSRDLLACLRGPVRPPSLLRCRRVTGPEPQRFAPGRRTARAWFFLPCLAGCRGGNGGTRLASSCPWWMSRSWQKRMRRRPLYWLGSSGWLGCQRWPVSSWSAQSRKSSRWVSVWQMNSTNGGSSYRPSGGPPSSTEPRRGANTTSHRGAAACCAQEEPRSATPERNRLDAHLAPEPRSHREGVVWLLSGHSIATAFA